ncbi:MAG: hypothetical protein ABIZ04_24110 [Opitutus sp.]
MKIAAKKTTDWRKSGPLQIVRDGMEALQDLRGCYTWFERCRLEAHVGRERLVPVFAYAPMGKRFRAPPPPSGLSLKQRLFFLASAAILYPCWLFFVTAWSAL